MYFQGFLYLDSRTSRLGLIDETFNKLIDQNLAYTKTTMAHSPNQTNNTLTLKMLSKLDLEAKSQGNQKIRTLGTKNMPPKKNLIKGSLSNRGDADADAESTKTIC